MPSLERRFSSAWGLLLAAAILCVSRTSTGVFANLAAAAAKRSEECAVLQQQRGGAIPPAVLVMLVEAAKLLISLSLWHLERRATRQQALPGPGAVLDAKAAAAEPGEPAQQALFGRHSLLFAPPAVLYCSCNVLWLVALQRLAAPVFEMLSTLRIVLSVALAWAFTQSGAALRTHHYAALGLLVAANLLAHWGLDVSTGASAVDVVLVLASISSSAIANVVFELLTKERFHSTSLHLQNVQLYSWGVLFNGAVFLGMRRWQGGAVPDAWLPCVNGWHLLLICAFACVGIVTGIVLKYHGNVASVVAQSFAVHLSALLSHLSIRFMPTWQFVSGAVLCQAAILLYNRDALWAPNA